MSITYIEERRQEDRGESRRAPRAPAGEILIWRWYFHLKVFFDLVLGALILALSLPIVGFLVLFVRLTSPGPGIYRQVRVGRHGQEFLMYKIRTMRHDAEVVSGPRWTQVRDPRVTAVGKVLRHLHLDELPQLLNVMKGEMSLIGPRPERPEFVHALAEAIPGYLSRLEVLPGITGLAQLNLSPDTDLDSVRRKLVLDSEYIRRAGLLLDLRILGCSVLRVFKFPECWALPMFGLSRTVILEAVPEGAADTGGNGNGHPSVTPASILVQVAGAPSKSNGSHPGRETPFHMQSRRNSAPSKPR